MARIGLKNFLFGNLYEQPDGTAEYGTAVKPGKAVSCSVSISNNSGSLYADDAIAESDTSFQSGTVTLTIDDEDLEVMAKLLGHTYNSTDKSILRKTTDVAPYVGLGRVITKIIGGTYKYKVEFLYKVKFAEPSQEDNTKGESIEFGTTQLEGTLATLASGEWSKGQTFDTEAAAITFLEGMFGDVSE